MFRGLRHIQQVVRCVDFFLAVRYIGTQLFESINPIISLILSAVSLVLLFLFLAPIVRWQQSQLGFVYLIQNVIISSFQHTIVPSFQCIVFFGDRGTV